MSFLIKRISFIYKIKNTLIELLTHLYLQGLSSFSTKPYVLIIYQNTRSNSEIFSIATGENYLIMIKTIMLTIFLGNQMGFVGLHLLVCALWSYWRSTYTLWALSFRVDQRVSIHCWPSWTIFQTLWFQDTNQSQTSTWYPCRWLDPCCSHRVQQDHIPNLDTEVSIRWMRYSSRSP